MFKILLLKNCSAPICEITLQASSNIVDSKLLKSLPRINNVALRWVQNLIYNYIGKMFKNILLKNYNAAICCNLVEPCGPWACCFLLFDFKVLRPMINYNPSNCW